jgi:hypothetical protein
VITFVPPAVTSKKDYKGIHRTFNRSVRERGFDKKYSGIPWTLHLNEQTLISHEAVHS